MLMVVEMEKKNPQKFAGGRVPVDKHCMSVVFKLESAFDSSRGQSHCWAAVSALAGLGRPENMHF